MTTEELQKILKKHALWLDCEDGGERADLRGADLRGANLRGAYLCSADLRGADLRGADLRGADLDSANLRGAYLRGADLRSANLRGADLRGAYLCSADLRGADLDSANLRGAYLCSADLDSAKNLFIPISCPEKGSFIGFKKAHGYIVVLEICEDAKRVSATSRKCRCDKAKVLSIENIDGSPANVTEAASNFDSTFLYQIGETVSVPNFDEDRWNECAPGIHFFITREEAVKYR